MRKLIVLPLAVLSLSLAIGCSGGNTEEPPPKGPEPEVKQADPGMPTPEERGRQNATGGGEGS